MDIQQLSNLMKNLEVSPVEIVQTFLDRIDKYDSKINSFISVFSQESIKEAKRIEKLFLNKEIVSPLQGIPVGLKDLIYTKNQLTNLLNSLTNLLIATRTKLILTKLGTNLI